MPLAAVWVVTYWILGHGVAAAIPAAYEVVSLAALAWFLKTKRYRFFRTSQLSLMLLLPFLLQWSLGGFVSSSAVMVWAFVAPMGALAFAGTRQAVPWFAAFALLTVLSGVFDAAGVTRPVHMTPGVVTTFFVLNVAGVAVVVYGTLVYFVRERERAMAALDEQHRLLKVEQDKSERLLLNVLPKAIAARLREEHGVIADAFTEATVLFADLVGFTELAGRLDPDALVAVLNRLFSAFDALAEERGLEKIKTIGDSYMVAGGIPEPRPDHAEAVADMALAMLHEVRDVAEDTGFRLAVRIGIDTGPVIAGVIGTRKFTYDLWGDTVNTASRMESLGQSGRIHVSETTYARLRRRYSFEERGTVYVKGKGEMATYFLTGRRGTD